MNNKKEKKKDWRNSRYWLLLILLIPVILHLSGIIIDSIGGFKGWFVVFGFLGITSMGVNISRLGKRPLSIMFGGIMIYVLGIFILPNTYLGFA